MSGLASVEPCGHGPAMRLGVRTAAWALALSSIPMLGMAALTFYCTRTHLRAEIDGQLIAAARS